MSSVPEREGPVRIALLGVGVVGSQVLRLLAEQADDLAARVGAPLEVVGAAVRNLDAPRPEWVDPALLTTDAASLVRRADVVVELMGGIEPARSLLLDAMENGASVVTANKALLASDGPALYEAAASANVDIYYEAAVAGAIPLVRPIRESLAGDRIERVIGIVNGTTNFILDEMTTRAVSGEEALADAQRLGYAEADPTADIDGYDAAAKAAILASIAFHTRVPLEAVTREGIGAVSAADVAAAAASGHVIKLLAIVENSADGIHARVHPALLPARHPLAGVHGSFNAVFVQAEAAGELMFYGRGAGGAPTASAVLGDVVSAARHRVDGGRGPRESAYADLPIAPAGSARTRYQVRLDVADRSGVLAQVAAVVASHGVSIEAVRQTGRSGQGTAELIITTHAAREADLATTVAEVGGLDVVHAVASILRVEGA